jgi:Flp pilus assembly protein TadG
MEGIVRKPMSFLNIRDEFLGDEGGSISIEFMVVFPLLLFLAISGLGFWDAFQSNSKTAKVAYAVSDIMSRHSDVDDTDMAYLYSVQDKMLDPALDRRFLRISSICFEDDNYRVLWSFTANSADITDPGALRDEDIPVDILPTMAPQDSVILTEIQARWQPKINVGVVAKTWRNALVSRPRFVKIIPHADLNPSNICPSGA